ncbi:efflux transporter outer membrane subunit [Planctomycetales bacterium ZRK34]|nr:efflux transporter outer membrane subunit [Planctomycetales bacterium ZRK34]
MAHKKSLCLLGAILCLGGCNLAPKYERPAAPVPNEFPVGPAYTQALAEAESAIHIADLPWQEFFTDEPLRKTIALALANNRDLRIAALNVQRSRALYGIQRAELLPIVNAVGDGSRQRVPADLSSTGQRNTVSQYSVNFGFASWEIDLFGRLRNLSDAALQEYFATEQARRGTQIMLVSELAGTYMLLAADRESLRVAENTLKAQQDAYDLVRRRLERGLVPELDLYRAQTQVDNARRSVALYTQLVAQDINALDLLAGQKVPESLYPKQLSQVQSPRGIEPGITSAVLLDRPDIAAAELRLKAANANIGAARAAFFPRISLTTAAGTASSDLSGLFKSGSGVWSYGPQVVMPIFDPRTWSAVEVSKADREIAVAEYERSIQAGFRDVADVLAVRGTVDEQLAAQQSLVDSVAKTYDLSRARYEKGIDNYLAVLDAQRSLFDAQQGLITLNLTKQTNQIQLYAALGGGWQNPESEPDPDPAPTPDDQADDKPNQP